MAHELNTIVEPRDQQRFLVCSCGAKVSLGWFPSAEQQMYAIRYHIDEVLEASGQSTASSVPVQDVPLDKRKLRMSWVNDAGEEDALVDVRPTLSEESSGGHYDQGKSRLELIDSQWLNAVGDVLAYGASKYGKEVGGGEHNWRKGIKVSRLLGSLLRHTFEVLRGNDIDAESGLPHIAHASCCAMFIYATLKSRPDLDDRYKDTPNA